MFQSNWFSRRRRDRELDEEIRAHLAMAERDRADRGETASDAAANARREFGNIGLVKEVTREIWGAGSLERLGQDTRFAARILAKAPAFSLTAVLTLALGIGCCTAIFTFVDTLLLRPLPFPDPGRLMMVWEANYRNDRKDNVVAPADYFDWKAQNGVFESMAAVYKNKAVLSDNGEPVEVEAHWVSSGFFPTLGVTPLRGRLISPDDDRPGAPGVVLITDRLWQQRFGGNPGIVGRNIIVNARPTTIIGVLPPGFRFLNRDVDVWQPFGLDPSRNWRKGAGRFMLCIARLKPGVSRERAQAEMESIARRLEQDHPEFNKGWTVNLVPFRDQFVKETRRSLLLLSAAVALLLFIACANVANLLLARATSREQEMAMRLALGAGRARLVRQLITEAAVLAMAAAVAGLVLARVLLKGLLLLSPTLDSSADFSLDLRVMLFSVGLAMCTAFAFGLAPAFHVLGPGKGQRSGARATSGAGRRLRATFAGVQVGLTAILLVSAGLLLRSFVRLQGVEPGLNPKSVLTARVSLPGSKYDGAQPVAFFRDAAGALGAIPGVRAASAVSYLPFTGDAAGTSVRIAGRPAPPPGEELYTVARTVLPGYFQAIGIHLLEGRDFADADNVAASPHRFIVNRAFVEKYLRGERPLDQSISVRMDRENPFGKIIGVVADVREGSLDKDPEPTAYYPHAHLPYPTMTLVLKTEREPMSYATAVQRTIQRLDPAQPVSEVRTMEEVLGATLARQRLNALVTLAFSIAATLLAAVGLYGILSYSVGERTREFGIRLALGQKPSSLLFGVVRQGVAMSAAGLGAGIAGALAVTRLLSGLLFGIKPLDAITYEATAAVLLGVSVLAAYVPARRATRVDPAVALRHE